MGQVVITIYFVNNHKKRAVKIITNDYYSVPIAIMHTYSLPQRNQSVSLEESITTK